MDMDINPRSQTSTVGDRPADTKAPSPFAMKEDPFKEDTKPPIPPGPVVGHGKKGGAGKKVLLVLLVLVLMAASAGAVWYWQNSKVKDLQSQVNNLNSQLNAMQSRGSSQETQAAVSQATDDQLVLTAAQAACLTVDDPATAQPMVFKIGTIGAQKKEIVYTANKTYASLNATCGTAANPGAQQTFYVEKANNGTWVTTYYGTAAPDATITKKFGIPAANTFN